MMQRFSALTRRGTHATAVGLCAGLLFVGCKKKPDAGGPPPSMATTVLAAEARRQPVAETLAVVGTLAANEFVEVKSETDGAIAEILFQEGQPVKKGDLLVRLDESKFSAAVREAEASLKLSDTTFGRVKELFREKLVSQQEYDQAAATFQVNQATLELRKRQLQDARLYAPFAGVAGARNISAGQVINKNTSLTWVVDVDVIKAEFNVPERFLSQMKQGQTVELTVAAYPGVTFPGEVYFLAPLVDPNTRTMQIKARVPNPDHKLKPGMFANLDLRLTLREEAIVIPESALLTMGERTLVYVIGLDGTTQPRPVKVGIRLANQIEIIGGLQPGEKVVAEGLQKIRPGGQVKMLPPEAPAAATAAAAR